ncbi:MAG TPA: hypothetical protein VJX73_15265 [Terracidiphilus sp.]|nr:hypothetical protein [Terracidiphilus sp.]
MHDRSAACASLIRDAARRTLGPLGLQQKGRSRLWFSDQGWWLIVVEFQPSGFSVGSYLNVACMWLWHVKDYISFDLGDRVDQGSSFTSAVQFKPVAESLAQRAAVEAQHYRDLFPSVRSLSDYCIKNPPVIGWPSFHAAIAHGLVGRIELSRKLFDTWGSEAESNTEWVKAARSDSKELERLVGDQAQFRRLVVSRVNETRALQKLAPLPEIDFGLRN